MIKKLLAGFAACAVAATSMAVMSFTAAAEQIGQGTIIGMIGDNSQWEFEGAEGPLEGSTVASIEGDTTYSTLMKVSAPGNPQFLAVAVKELITANYPDLSVTVDKIRVDGVDLEGAAEKAVVTMDYFSSGFQGLRIYLIDSWGGDCPSAAALTTDMTVNESVEVIYTISGTGIQGPEFVDENAPSEPTDEPTEPTDETEPTDVTDPSDATEPTSATTAATTVATVTTAKQVTTVNKPVNGASATTTKPSATSPTTGDAGIGIAIAGLIITAGAAVISKKNK